MREHLANVADNLQLVADLGYGDAALAIVDARGLLSVLADARPSTAADPIPASRVGQVLSREEEPEAYAAVERRHAVEGSKRCATGGVTRSCDAFPIGAPRPYAVVLRTYGEQLDATSSRMENAFIGCSRDLLETLRTGPILDARSGEPFSTSRSPGDGLLRVGARGSISYASPNAVSIMRIAGVEGRVTSMRASELPGGGAGISPVVGATGAVATEIEVAGRILGYRALSLSSSVLVLVEDLTEERRRERELDVKEATIREVHHRVKNNLQTIASLLRMQARRSDSAEVRRALTEATERAASMATVHDLLAHSTNECVDFSEVAGRVVALVRDSLIGDEGRIAVSVSGSLGQIDAAVATSLALALTELVHNALLHAFEPGAAGAVEVQLGRTASELVLSVRDDGRGMPDGADLLASGSLGFSIVRTLVEEDLRGSLAVRSEHGSEVTIRVPLPDAAA